MDFASALKPDIYRVVAVNLVPGFVGTAPWIAGVFWTRLQDSATWQQDGLLIPIGITLAATVMAAGLLFEDIGSRIEVHWADRWLLKNYPRLARGWRTYLSTKRDNELIAQGYLRAILLRFKFELSMIPALLCSASGLIAAHSCGDGLGRGQTQILSMTLLLLMALLLQEVRSGAGVLAKTRHVIIRAARMDTQSAVR